MKFYTIALLAFVLLAQQSSVLKADYFLEFRPQTPLLLGGSSTVDIVLRENRISGALSNLGTKVTIWGNIRFTWSGSTAFTVSNLQDHGVQNGREFDNGGLGAFVNLDTTLGFGTVEQSDFDIDPSVDPLGTIVSDTEATLRLGSFVVSGGAEGETVTFQMVDFDNVLDDIILEDGTVLDGVIDFRSMDFTVSAVPEPSSMLALGALVGGVGYRQWRRRRTARTRTQA
jgi:hypothetical protein